MIDRGDRCRCWALVPAKPLRAAKSRLAQLLTPPQRAGLARAMLEDVLETLTVVKYIDRILVVSRDHEIGVIARDYGSRLLGEPVGGLNVAVRHGIRWLCERGVDGVLVAPGDIPFTAVREFEDIIVAMRSTSLVLVPAYRDGGTNVIGIALPNEFVPQFGADSFVRHWQEAYRVGIKPTSFLLAGAGHDIDVPVDLQMDFPGSAGRKTRAFLAQLNSEADGTVVHHGKGIS